MLDRAIKRFLEESGIAPARRSTNPPKSSGPAIIKTPIERSTVEFVVGLIIALVCAVWPMNWRVLSILLLIIALLSVDICRRINAQRLHKVALSTLSVLILFAIFFGPLTDRYRSEHEIPETAKYLKAWGVLGGGYVISNSVPPKVLYGEAKLILVVNGPLLFRYKTRYRLIGVALHIFEGGGDYMDKPGICKSDAYNIANEDIHITIPLNEQFLSEAVQRNARGDNFFLLATPIGIKPGQFGSLAGAEKLGARIISRAAEIHQNLR